MRTFCLRRLSWKTVLPEQPSDNFHTAYGRKGTSEPVGDAATKQHHIVMEERMNGEKKEVPKGTLGRVELYCLSIGQVIGAGVITLVGPAITRA